MGFILDEKDLMNLEKQTLIKMLLETAASNDRLLSSVERLEKSVALLTEEVAHLRQNRFGRSSEKKLIDTSDEGYTQLCFAFNETEIVIDLNPLIKEPSLEEVINIKEHKRSKKSVGKRKEEIKNVEVQIISHTLSEEELREAFPDGKWQQREDEVYSRLVFRPASFIVEEHHVQVFSGKGNQRFVRAKRPVDLFRNSLCTPSLLAGIYNLKYVNAQPIERLAKEFERNDVFIPHQTMCRWAIMGTDRYLSRIYDRLKSKLSDYHVIHADETPVEVRRDGRPAGTESRMWVYRSGEHEPHPLVLYEYQKTRKAEHPRKFLKEFSGICMTDGYQVYHTIADERDDLTIAGCWAHARRDFADVIKTSGKSTTVDRNSIAYKCLQIIQTMSQYEKTYAEMSPEERLAARERNVQPLVDAFFAYLKSVKDTVAPKSKTGKGISYCLNQEKFLRVFLTDGYVPMTNNAAERSIRPFTLGRKNWYVIDTISGAKSSAIAYSIAETAKENNLKPYEYFKYLLEELPKHGELESDLSYLDDLLPWSDSLPNYCRRIPQSKD